MNQTQENRRLNEQVGVLDQRIESLEAALKEIQWRLPYAVSEAYGGKYSQEGLNNLINDALEPTQ